MSIKHVALSFAVAAVATAATATAADMKKPVAQWTCADFLAVDDPFKPRHPTTLRHLPTQHLGQEIPRGRLGGSKQGHR
jgi:hypothetical protein